MGNFQSKIRVTHQGPQFLEQPGFQAEMLEMILGHLDEQSSKKAALISPFFYKENCFVRRKKPQILDLSKRYIEQEKFYDSIMRSQRRINSVKLVSWADDEIKIERYLDILEKFKASMAKLHVDFKGSWDNCFKFLLAASGVEVLILNLRHDSEPTKRRRIELQPFCKLKSLVVFRCPEAAKLFEAIALGSLEQLICVSSVDVSDDALQQLINRQHNIKMLSIEGRWDINIDRLILKDLTVGYPEHLDRLSRLFGGQHELRTLDITTEIDNATFALICRLRKLKRLSVKFISFNDIDEEDQDLEGGDNPVEVQDRAALAGLRNLQDLVEFWLTDQFRSGLEFWPGSQFLGQAVLPKLQKLELMTEDCIDPQVFTAMGGGMRNLQQLKINLTRIDALPRIVENFQALQGLELWMAREAEDNDLVPARPNESLEALRVTMPMQPGQSTYATINACPNLKSLSLTLSNRLTAGCVACVRQLAQLTKLEIDHNWYGLLPNQQDGQEEPLLIGIIENFRDSPGLVELRLKRLPQFRKQLVDDVFGADIVNISLNHYPGYRGYDLSITKKLRV